MTRLLCWIFLVCAATVFVARGPMRALDSPHGGGDLAPPFAAAKAWLAGTNPYDMPAVREIMRGTGRELDPQGVPAVTASLYPPPTLVVVAPLTVLSWPAARALFLVLNLVLVALVIRALLRMTQLRRSETAGIFLVAALLALAPFHTGISVGQLAIPSIALLVLAIDRIRLDRDRSGGLLLGIAALLKPQIAGPFLVYYALRRRWTVVGIATAAAVSATAISLAWLAINEVQWMDSMLANNREQIEGGAMDPGGAQGFHLVDARVALHALGVPSTGAMALLLGALVVVLLWRAQRMVGTEQELLMIGALAVLTLLVTYHRFYDAAILCLPLAWAVRAANRDVNQRWMAVAAVLCCAVFFIPGQVMFARFAEEGRVAEGIARSRPWKVVALGHQAWTLLLLQALLIAALMRNRGARA